MKNFEKFIKEHKKYNLVDLWKISEPIVDYVKKELMKIQKGGENPTVTTMTSREDIPGIGKRSDYELEDGSYSHMILGVRYFFGNSAMIEDFNNLTEYGNYLIEIENKIKSLFEIEKVKVYNGYFCYLIQINDKVKSLADSLNKIEKFEI